MPSNLIRKMKNMRLKILKKLVDAITLLSQPAGTTLPALCERLAIDKQQAYRVIDEIQSEFKIMIDKDKPLSGGETRYCLDREFIRRLSEIKVADLNLTFPEMMSLYFIKGHARLYHGTDIEANIDRAFGKLDVFLPDGFACKLEKIKALFLTTDKLSKDYAGKEENIEKLTDALLRQKTCHVEYHSYSSGKVSHFDINPLKLFEWNGGLYLSAMLPEYDNIRTLAVERFSSISVTGKDFSFPENFNPDEVLEDAFGIIYDDPVSVKIRFHAATAPYIRERKWCKNQQMEICDDGSVLLSMNTSGWIDVKKWILSFGADAELLEPDDKRKEVQQAIAQMAALYAPAGQSPDHASLLHVMTQEKLSKGLDEK